MNKSNISQFPFPHVLQGRRTMIAMLGLAGVTLGQLPTSASAQSLLPRLVTHQLSIVGEPHFMGSARAKGVSPTSYYFPDTGVGQESVAVFTLTNSDAYGGTLTVNGPPTVTGAGFVALALSANCSGGVLAAGASCQVAAKFRPTAATFYYGSLNLNTTPATSSVYLEGYGVPVITPTVTPAGLDFGAQPTGTESATQRVTLANNSIEGSLRVSSITLPAPFDGIFCQRTLVGLDQVEPGGMAKRLGPPCANFYGGLSQAEPPSEKAGQGAGLAKAAYSNNLGVCPQGNFELYSGDYCHVDVFFAPQSIGEFQREMVVAGSLGQRVGVPLRGLSGAKQAIELSSPTLSFGEVNLRRSGGPLGVSIKNSGFEALTINNISVVPPRGTPMAAANLKAVGAAADYAITHDCSALQPAQICGINVKFSPTELGPRPAEVMIEGTFEGSPKYVSLSGTGAPIPFPFLSYSVSSLAFGRAQFGSGGTETFDIRNAGQLPVRFNAIYATGDFVISHNCPAVLSAAAACKVTVTYRASVPGTSTGEIFIESDAQEVNRSIPISGSSCRPPSLRGGRLGLGGC
ncbi:MAG: choice-of-anchor D domain-containing protein [Burkholderiales bacterium]|nr:choice-of-anchor D domain-containing protein [Burkholderiales bacterium]